MIEGKLITLYNYNSYRVFVVTQLKPDGVAILPYEDDVAGSESFSMEELRNINNKSSVIKNAIVRIEKEDEEEVKKALGIYGFSDNDWTDEEIQDVVLKPTPAKLESVKRITSITVLDNFLAIISAEEGKREFMLSNHVREVVTARKDEIAKNKLKSEIELVKSSTPADTIARTERIPDSTVPVKPARKPKTKA